MDRLFSVDCGLWHAWDTVRGERERPQVSAEVRGPLSEGETWAWAEGIAMVVKDFAGELCFVVECREDRPTAQANSAMRQSAWLK